MCCEKKQQGTRTASLAGITEKPTTGPHRDGLYSGILYLARLPFFLLLFLRKFTGRARFLFYASGIFRASACL